MEMGELILLLIIFILGGNIALDMLLIYRSSEINKAWYEEELRRHNEIVDAIKKGENEDGEN